MTDRKWWLVWAAALGVLLWNVGDYGVIETSDARYAQIGWQMWLSGDWLHPSLLEIHHYHKPPLTYWLTALGYTLFGPDPFGARFFLQLALLVQAALVYALAKTLWRDQTVARAAALIYFALPLVLASGRNLTTDAYLTTFALAAVYFWARYRQSGGWRWLYLHGIALGLGFLTKGPVVFIAPLLFALYYNRIEPSKRPWSRHHLLAWGLALLLGAWWFVYLAASNPAFWDYFIKRQTVERFSSDVFHRYEPFWYYWVFAPLAGLPWLAALPWLYKAATRRENGAKGLIAAGLGGIFFFSLSASKRIFYILPLLFFFALAAARLLADLPLRRLLVFNRLIAAYAALGGAAMAVAPLIGRNVAVSPWWQGWALLLALYGAWRLYRPVGERLFAPFLTALFSALLVLYASSLMARSPDLVKTPVAMTEWMKAHGLDRRLVVVYDKRLPSVSFHLQKGIVSLYDGDRSLNRETQFETDGQWRRTLYNLKDPAERERLKKRLRNVAYVVIAYRRPLPPSRRWLIAPLSREKRFGRWILYY